MTEHTSQTMLFNWAAWQSGKHPELKLMYSIPNAGKRSLGAAAYMRSEGLKSGVPDVCLPVPRGGYGALYIEMKTIKGKVSDKQADWILSLSAAGNCVRVCRSYEEAIEVITEYLRLPKDSYTDILDESFTSRER
jgi:hypothetical protein